MRMWLPAISTRARRGSFGHLALSNGIAWVQMEIYIYVLGSVQSILWLELQFHNMPMSTTIPVTRGTQAHCWHLVDSDYEVA